MNHSSPLPHLSVAIIVLNWEDQEGTLAALEHLSVQLPHQGAVWIVDNDSKCPLQLSRVFSFPIHLIRSEINRGFAGGNNLALKAILQEDVEYVLLLNSDAQFVAGELQVLYQYAISHPDIDIMGPIIQEGRSTYYGGLDPGIFLNTRRTDYGAVDYISGTAMLCKTEVFKSIGLLDEQYFFSGEIADFCRRALDENFRIELVTTVKIEHQVDTRSEHRNTLYLYYNLRNRFLYIWKHHRNQKNILYGKWVLRLIRLGIGALVSAQLARARAVWLALVDGLMHNFGNRNDRFI